MKISKDIEVFWNAFIKSSSCPLNANELFQASYQIGSSDTDANNGLELILSGEKTATSSLLWSFEKVGEPIPKVGDLCVIKDGENNPVCVVQTTWVELKEFGDLDLDFVKDYSETNGTLVDWYRIFREFYKDECLTMNKTLTDKTPLVCERFNILYSQ